MKSSSSYPYFVFLFTWFLISCLSCSSMMQCIGEEGQALLLFKQGIDIDSCGLLDSWDGQSDCCQWGGIRCDNLTNHVISLHLSGNDFGHHCLKGKISPSLLVLKHLKYLDLSYNDLGQTIPSFIGSLLNLQYLNLSWNHFHEEIPHQLANLSSLTSLDLSYNYLNDLGRGLYVKSLGWLSHLTLLRDINLNVVELSRATDWMQVVNNLPLLKSLQMYRCSLSPSIPSSLVYTNSSTTLRVLSLANNNFNDRGIFQWLFNLTGPSPHLVHLDLSCNGISGPIPSAIGNIHSLSYLSLSDNEFEGPPPESISNLKFLEHLDLSSSNFQWSSWNLQILGNLCRLRELHLSGNDITNELSAVIQTLSQLCTKESLVSLDIGNNSLWGSIPDEICTFSSLRVLHLYSNQLNGTISPCLGQLSTLEELVLSDNFLKGTLSEQHLSNLSRLRILDMSDNPELVINISAKWPPPFQLDDIGLGSCKLGPYFPNWILTQMNFSSLDMSRAGISDTIPLSFWKLLPSNYFYMNISNNKFRGILPEVSVVFNEYFSTLDLSSNLFTGAIPSFLGNAGLLSLNDNLFSEVTSFFCPKTQVRLSYVDLSNNLLSGELPNCWGYFNQLTALRLDNNNLSGNLPVSIGVLTKLQALHLRNNSISGMLPMALQNCTSLRVLDLSYNSLTGHIPHWIGNHFSSLNILNLRSNSFLGVLPLSLCELSQLLTLDLSSNHLSEFLPNCIYNLTAMTNLPLSSSISLNIDDILSYDDSAWIMWKRREWSFMGSLGQVISIDISNNELDGPIPDQISSLTGLKSLNLSRNRLNGSITPKIGQLRSLESLDLSSNQLCGEIPTSLSGVSSLAILNLSNNNLSGRIPLGTQLQTFDPSSYMGNPGLCGDPLPKCPGDRQPPTDLPREGNRTHEDENEDDDIFLGLYVSVVLGFIVGFWGVCGTLVIKRSWRHAYFRFVEDIKDRLYVMVAVSITRIWRNT